MYMLYVTENDTIGTYFGNEKADSNVQRYVHRNPFFNKHSD